MVTGMQQSKLRATKQMLFSLLAGTFLIAGNLVPGTGWLFYPGLFTAGLIFNNPPISRWSAYAFFLPYFTVLGMAVWQAVFPWYSGVLLALLLAELFGRLFFILIRQAGNSASSFLVLPGFLFFADFMFRNLPPFNRINLFTLLSPVYQHPWVLALVSVCGVSLTVWILSAGLSAAAILIRPAGKQAGHQTAWSEKTIRPALTRPAFAVLLTCFVFTGITLAWYQDTAGLINSGTQAKTIHVAVVQGSCHTNTAVQCADDLAELHQDRLNHYLALAQPVQADLYVFPELEFGIWDKHNQVDQAYRASFQAAAKSLGGLLVLCVTEGDSITKSREDRYFSAVLLDSQQVYGLTAKRNLVPFSETSRYSAGTRYDVYQTPAGKLGVSICYDLQGTTIGRLKRNGAELILAPFNDSSFGIVYHRIHRAEAVLHAAESAVPVAMANEDGLSQLVDNRGKVMQTLGIGEQGVISADLTLQNRFSPYLVAGHWIARAFGIMSASWFGWLFWRNLQQMVRRRRGGKTDRDQQPAAD